MDFTVIYLFIIIIIIFIIESKLFQLEEEEEEEGGGVGTFSSWENISCNQFLWVRMHNIEYTVIGANPKHFFTIREGDIGYTLQSSSNSFGQYLTVIELKFTNLIFSSKFKHLIITFENFKQTAKWNKQ